MEQPKFGSHPFVLVVRKGKILFKRKRFPFLRSEVERNTRKVRRWGAGGRGPDPTVTLFRLPGGVAVDGPRTTRKEVPRDPTLSLDVGSLPRAPCHRHSDPRPRRTWGEGEGPGTPSDVHPCLSVVGDLSRRLPERPTDRSLVQPVSGGPPSQPRVVLRVESTLRWTGVRPSGR